MYLAFDAVEGLAGVCGRCSIGTYGVFGLSKNVLVFILADAHLASEMFVRIFLASIFKGVRAF